MVLRPRTRLQLRRAVVAAALGALFVPAVADAKKAKTPVITKVTPKTADVGTKLTITGKNFRRGKAKNSVLFRRDKGKALFVKADVSTTKKLTVIVPKTLEKYMLLKGSTPTPTRFRLRVLASKLSKAYTSAKLSPVIGPERSNSSDGNSGGAGVPTSPDGDCDSDGVKNGVDIDDDNDLLADSLELSLVLDPCTGDTDGDGVEDGFEYQSAIDLNNDDYQHPNRSLPYPGKTPYPNPLFKDADKDFDGDGLDLERRVQALEVHVPGQRHGDPHALPAVLLRRRAVLAVGARQRHRRARADDDRGRLPAAAVLPQLGRGHRLRDADDLRASPARTSAARTTCSTSTATASSPRRPAGTTTPCCDRPPVHVREPLLGPRLRPLRLRRRA